MSLTLAFRKGSIAIEVVFAIILLLGIVAGLVYTQNMGRDLVDTLDEQGSLPDTPVKDAIVQQNHNQSSIFDWGIMAFLVVLIGGSFYFTSKSGQGGLVTIILVVIMIIVAVVAAYLSNFWSDSVDVMPSIADHYPKTNWFFNHYVESVVVIILLQIFFSLAVSRNGGGF